MKRMVFVVAAALALAPIAGGVAMAKPSDDNPRERVFYSGSANRDNCSEVSRTTPKPRRIAESHSVTVRNEDGSYSEESVTTYRYEQRPTRVYMVCQYN